MDTRNVLKLIFSIAVCELAGVVGSVFTYGSIREWYIGISKPAFTPANGAFPLVWTTLFLLMGISLYFVLKEDYRKTKIKTGISLFSIQLLLNITWTFLFFGLRNPFYAFIEIFVLWLFILLTIYQFWKIKKEAAYLLVPYVIWVSFAIVLNYYIWMMNA